MTSYAGATPSLMVNMSGNGTDLGSENVAFDKLYPAIVQCFVIILSGYIAGRLGYISHAQSKGISIFISHFSLPALLFKSMMELDFSAVNWKFLASILIGKTSVFALVVFFSILLHRPVHLGRAGLFAIFATQSNDFALGYPIVQALYSESHPDYLSYIYLVAPISLAFLNPIGFILMEVSRRQEHHSTGNKTKLMLHVLKGVVTNPVVFMTVFGIIANVISDHTVPPLIKGILQVLGDAFSATALFLLGLSMVGKVKAIQGTTLVVPVLLIACKTLLLPFVTREVVTGLQAGGDDNDTAALANYGFLYSTFPTAPSVFVFASQYNIANDLIATGMVVCTILSAPLMFISAKMVTLTVTSEADYRTVLTQTSFDISILSIICSVWVISVVVLTRRWKNITHQFTICLVFSQFLSCLGMTLSHGFNESSSVSHFVSFVILFTGVLATRVWTALLAVALYLLKVKGIMLVRRFRAAFIITGFGLPTLLTGILLLASPNHKPDAIDPAFHYGVDQLVMSASVIASALVVTIVSLTLYQRGSSHHEYTPLLSRADTEPLMSEDSSDSANNKYTDEVNGAAGGQVNNNGGLLNGSAREATSESNSRDRAALHNVATDLVNRAQEHEGSGRGRRTRDMFVNRTVSSSEDNEEEAGGEETVVRGLSMAHDPQLGRHVVLLLILVVSMGVGVFLCTWRLFHESTSGIYIEIEFLDSVFNFGQAFFVFMVFGLDLQFIFVPFKRKWRKLMYGTEQVHLPSRDHLDYDVIHTCDIFLRHHVETCRRDIVADRRYRLTLYRDVFTGTQLVDWLLEFGLAEDRSDAVAYGSRLLLGRVIKHVANEHHFRDLQYFYIFCPDATQSQTP